MRYPRVKRRVMLMTPWNAINVLYNVMEFESHNIIQLHGGAPFYLAYDTSFLLSY